MKEQKRRQCWITLARWLARLQARCLTMAADEPVWVSTDGTAKTYSELGDRHLRNILHLLRREGLETNHKTYTGLLAEAKRRGIIA